MTWSDTEISWVDGLGLPPHMENWYLWVWTSNSGLAFSFSLISLAWSWVQQLNYLGFFSFRVSDFSSLTNLPIGGLCERLIVFVILSMWRRPHALTPAECLCKGLPCSGSQNPRAPDFRRARSLTHNLPPAWFHCHCFAIGARPCPCCLHTIFCFGIRLTKTKMDRVEPRAKGRQDASEEEGKLSLLSVKTHY